VHNPRNDLGGGSIVFKSLKIILRHIRNDESGRLCRKILSEPHSLSRDITGSHHYFLTKTNVFKMHFSDLPTLTYPSQLTPKGQMGEEASHAHFNIQCELGAKKQTQWAVCWRLIFVTHCLMYDTHISLLVLSNSGA
jgi:hypothetical protein